MISRVLILLVLMIGSGCANRYIDPLCLDDKPSLQPISIEEQRVIPAGTLEKLALNEEKLKTWISTTILITEAHNEQFKAKCGKDL